MLNRDPKARTSAKQLEQHPWFTEWTDPSICTRWLPPKHRYQLSPFGITLHFLNVLFLMRKLKTYPCLSKFTCDRQSIPSIGALFVAILCVKIIANRGIVHCHRCCLYCRNPYMSRAGFWGRERGRPPPPRKFWGREEGRPPPPRTPTGLQLARIVWRTQEPPKIPLTALYGTPHRPRPPFARHMYGMTVLFYCIYPLWLCFLCIYRL